MTTTATLAELEAARDAQMRADAATIEAIQQAPVEAILVAVRDTSVGPLLDVLREKASLVSERRRTQLQNAIVAVSALEPYFAEELLTIKRTVAAADTGAAQT